MNIVFLALTTLVSLGPAQASILSTVQRALIPRSLPAVTEVSPTSQEFETPKYLHSNKNYQVFSCIMTLFPLSDTSYSSAYQIQSPANFKLQKCFFKFYVPANTSIFIYADSIKVDCTNDFITFNVEPSKKICSSATPTGYKIASAASDYELDVILNADRNSPYPNFDLYVFKAKAISGNWGEWMQWSGCSVTCGNGTSTRSRLCNSPPPSNGGAGCSGPSTESSSCSSQPCQIDGNWSAWSSWGACSAKCGTGSQPRTRTCTNPAPSNGGADCASSGSDSQDCNTQPCPIASNKILVALGSSTESPATDNMEVVDIASTSTVCNDLPAFPKAWFGPAGGLGFQDAPVVCANYTCFYFNDNAWTPMYHSLFPVMLTTTSGYQNLMLTGGMVGKNATEMLSTSGWVKKTDFPSSLLWSCGVKISSDTHFIIGGLAILPTFPSMSSTYFFHEDTQVWESGPPMSIDRYAHSCALINGDQNTVSVIAVGGCAVRSNLDNVLDSVEILEVGSSTWRAGPSLPVPIAGSQLVQDQSGGVVLIGGVNSFFELLPTLYYLENSNPGSNWVKMSQELKMPRYLFSAFLIPENITDCS